VKRGLATALAVLLAAVAGCGGGGASKSDFNKKFNPLNDQIVSLGKTVFSPQSETKRQKATNAEVATEFSGYAVQLDAIKTKISKLDAPDDYRSSVKKLLAALTKVSGDLNKISDAATKNDASAVTTSFATVFDDSRALKAAREELARKTGGKVG
jgi:ABC-type glycerol-3-phosphate transport system substrate-binding protein